MKLLLVESPSKCKKIEGFLGPGHKCLASVGHICEIHNGLKGIDKDTLLPLYALSRGKKRVVQQIQQQCQDATTVYLATDPDREGEAIAYHLCLFLGLCPETTPRVRFHEITKPAVLHAVANPTTLDMDLVRAQQARQVLDLYVGYKISPLLWKAVAPKLSAGRCQTPALRMVWDREKRVKDPRHLQRRLVLTADFDQGFSGCVLVDPLLTSWADVEHTVDALSAQGGCVEVVDKTVKICRQLPPPPFMTSTIQQDAHAALGLSPQHTMAVLQTLYEKGRITYMRTDSTALSETAVHDCGAVITKKYGADHFEHRVSVSKNPASQEAHEAIRPTKMATEALPAGCTDLEKKVYDRVWKRTLASQMIPYRFSESVHTLFSVGCRFQKTSRETLQQGWKLVYTASVSDSPLPDPPCVVRWQRGTVSEEFEKGKGRHSEASLIRELETRGIGRPSTFASLCTKLLERRYTRLGDVPGLPVERRCLRIDEAFRRKDTRETTVLGADRGKFVVSETGKQVLSYLEARVPLVVEDGFTGAMEKDLETIARDRRAYHGVVSAWMSKIDKSLFS